MDDLYCGTILLLPLYPTKLPPAGWAFCEGQQLKIAEHQMLYAILGTTFGGDGRLAFALPNLKGKEPVPNTRYCIYLQGAFPPLTE